MDLLEIIVREDRTRDGILILYHDKVGRTGEASKADGEGAVSGGGGK